MPVAPRRPQLALIVLQQRLGACDLPLPTAQWPACRASPWRSRIGAGVPSIPALRDPKRRHPSCSNFDRLRYSKHFLVWLDEHASGVSEKLSATPGAKKLAPSLKKRCFDGLWRPGRHASGGKSPLLEKRGRKWHCQQQVERADCCRDVSGVSDCPWRAGFKPAPTYREDDLT